MSLGRIAVLAALAVGVAASAAMSATAAGSASAPHTTYDLIEGMSPKSLYLLRCSGCHRVDGGGAPEAGVPPFMGSIGAIAADPEGRTYIMHVPGVASSGLNNRQLAEVMNYVLETWATDRPQAPKRFTEEEVSKLRAVPVVDVVSFRRAMAERMAKSGVTLAEYPWP